MNPLPITYCAPAGRSSPTEVSVQFDCVVRDQKFCEILDLLPDMVLLLNQNRQIVYANALFRKIIDLPQEKLLGMRPGEALGCLHADELEGGCGTSESCRYCGQVLAVMESCQGRSSSKECVVDARNGCQLNLRVTTKPIQLASHDFILAVLTDIQSEKRAEFLEKLFLHDILNYASGLQGIARLLAEAKAETQAELIPLLIQSADHLLEVIQSHRDLVQAESGDLEIQIQPLIPLQIMQHVGQLYQYHRRAKGKKIEVIDDCPNELFFSDQRILSRVLGNLVVNALEASQPGETITMRAMRVEDRILFMVHNTKEMPRSVQLQLFHRSFTTKGSGRGLGTYSIKLLTERYLQGKVSFSSDLTEGTTFTVDLPLQWEKVDTKKPDKPLVA